jgi:hypothetical protein
VGLQALFARRRDPYLSPFCYCQNVPFAPILATEFWSARRNRARPQDSAVGQSRTLARYVLDRRARLTPFKLPPLGSVADTAEGQCGDCCRCPIRWTQLFAKFGQLNNSSALFLGVSRLLGICVTLRKDRTQVIPFVIRQNDDCACERPPLFIAEQLPDPLIFGRDPGQCYYL